MGTVVLMKKGMVWGMVVINDADILRDLGNGCRAITVSPRIGYGTARQ